jgi:tetratricopeptide (TPR) repeat protein/transcriptional regulator with XRE-family HTH domain
MASMGAGDPAEDFPSWLRRRREALLITQEALAEGAGLSVRAIRYLESGRTRPRRHTRDAIRAALERLAGPPDDVLPDGTPPPAQLPLDQAAFVGRTAVLAALDGIAAEAADATRVVSITGGPGIGKTTLAVHWAHRARSRFPGGQLFADLRGFSPSAAPVDPGDLIQSFLEALGVGADQMPRRPADRIGLYRTILAGRAVLVVLDNAADPAQVRPLLPAAAGSMVVVTSRNQLADLVTGDGAHPVPIGPCSPAEGRELLAARLGAARLERETGSAEEIVKLCAGMPLALAVVAARAAAHPEFALADLVADLHDTGGAALTADVRPAMTWSYAALSEPAARAFRTLGLHPHPEVTAEVIAAVDDLGPAAARAVLDELADANLLTERRPGRFGMHDVIHAYAGEQASDTLTPAARNRIRRRLHQYYAGLAASAVHTLCPHLKLGSEVHPPGTVAPPEIRDARHAVVVLTAEHRVLSDLVRDAARAGDPNSLWRLAASLFIFYDRQGRWPALTPLAQFAARAAERLGDKRRRFDAERLTALAYGRNGNKRQARQRLEAAIRMADDAGDIAAVAAFHFDLGVLSDSDDRHADSAGHFDRALDAYRRADDTDGEAGALNALGWARMHLGEPGIALDLCRRALILHGLAGNRHGEASTLDTYGLALHRTGDVGQAVDAYRAALDLIPAIGDRHLESVILDHLGDAWESAGNLTRARATREQALAILDDIAPGKARQLRSRLLRSTG